MYHAKVTPVKLRCVAQLYACSSKQQNEKRYSIFNSFNQAKHLGGAN